MSDNSVGQGGGDWRDCVRINGLVIPADRLRYVIERWFYKNTAGVNLDTPGGCQVGAAKTVDLLSEIGEGGFVPEGAVPESTLLRARWTSLGGFTTATIEDPDE